LKLVKEPPVRQLAQDVIVAVLGLKRIKKFRLYFFVHQELFSRRRIEAGPL